MDHSFGSEHLRLSLGALRCGKNLKIEVVNVVQDFDRSCRKDGTRTVPELVFGGNF